MPPTRPQAKPKTVTEAPRFQVIHGNCLDVLPTLPAMSIDSVVTDPPYGLSQGGGLQSDSDRVFDTLRKIGFPKLYKWDVKSSQKGDLSSVPLSSPELGGMSGSVRIESRVGVPKGSINLKSNSINEKINTGSVPSSLGISDGELGDEGDISSGQFLGDFLLKLRDVNPSRLSGDVSDCCLAEAFAGGFAVPISPVLPTGFPSLTCSGDSVVVGDKNVGRRNNSKSQSKTSPSVVASSGAVNTLMLRFELSGGPVELLSTYRASADNTCLEESRSELVRARSTASSLSSVAKPHRVCFVSTTTDGTLTRYWFHLWTPRRMDFSGIVPTGGFMGKSWDSTLPDPEVWRAVLRVLKPGGYLLAFSGTRTYHRMVSAIEDAGFEVRDCLMWVYGSGFPKSHNVSKGIDKMYGHERRVVSQVTDRRGDGTVLGVGHSGAMTDDTPISEEAEVWDGWGSALKPSLEPICLAMRPLDGNIQRNVREHGTGALNIEACRIGSEVRVNPSRGTATARSAGCFRQGWGFKAGVSENVAKGRWPANLCHDGSEEVLALFPKTGASPKSKPRSPDGPAQAPSSLGREGGTQVGYDEPAGLSAARFFYCAKASARDRDEGLEDLHAKDAGSLQFRANGDFGDDIPQRKNVHTTVKPTSLMQWLVRLITPPGGTVLDPFTGSGSTGKACGLEGFKFLGIEMTEEYIEIARRRILFGYTNKPKK